jgi:hypothetical protein
MSLFVYALISPSYSMSLFVYALISPSYSMSLFVSFTLPRLLSLASNPSRVSFSFAFLRCFLYILSLLIIIQPLTDASPPIKCAAGISLQLCVDEMSVVILEGSDRELSECIISAHASRD